MLPSIAKGDSNKLWIIPSEIGKAMEGLGSAVGQIAGITQKAEGPFPEPELGDSAAVQVERGMGTAATPDAAVAEADNAVQEAIAAAEKAAVSSRGQQAATPAVTSAPEQTAPVQDGPTQQR